MSHDSSRRLCGLACVCCVRPLQVQRRFPDKGAKLLVACSNGRQYSIDALEALDEAGYTNIVGLRGGYTAWFRCAALLLGPPGGGDSDWCQALCGAVALASHTILSTPGALRSRN